jgi:hypothetical protein
MAKTYQTVMEIGQIVVDDLREGVSLEYKSSAILDSKGIGAICKAVSAFANSAGGQFVTGIESKDGKPHRLDGGFFGPSKLDWLHQILNSNTYPALENFDVVEIEENGGLYYVIEVPVSAKAPHQSTDNKYYKRRGPHSEPMEHYEIEDIRNRPKIDTTPLRVEITSEGILALLQFSNIDQFNPITDLSFSITANFDLKSGGINTVNARGIRRLAPGGSISFHAGSFIEILGSTSGAEISVDATYQFKGATFKYSQPLFVGDFENSAITRSATVRAIEAVTEKLDKVVDALKPAKQLVELLEQATDGSGMRLSKRTLEFLRGQNPKFELSEFDYRGYQIVADISLDDAIQFHNALTYGPVDLRRKKYLEISEKLREKFEKVFRVEFSQNDYE